MAKDRKLVLFLYVKGKEVKRVLTVPKFDEAVDITLIQSINGYRETLYEGRIEVNSSNENEAKVNDDEFEANLQGIIADQQEYEKEVQIQKEIENEFEEQIAADFRAGQEKAEKLQKEEDKRLAEMKRKLEEDKIKKKTTVSEKKKFK